MSFELSDVLYLFWWFKHGDVQMISTLSWPGGRPPRRSRVVRLDSFTVSLHKGTVSGFWKMVRIPTDQMNPQCTVAEAVPTYILTNQSHKDASLLEAMSHIPVTVLPATRLGPCSSLGGPGEAERRCHSLSCHDGLATAERPRCILDGGQCVMGYGDLARGSVNTANCQRWMTIHSE